MSRPTTRIFLALITFLLTSAAGAQDFDKCISGQIRVQSFGEVKVTRENYCYDQELVNFVSESCRHRKCEAFRGAYRYYAQDFLGPFGTPGFKLCRELGGSPEIVDFFAKGAFQRSDRCVFKDGFVDTDTLFDFYILRDGPEDDTSRP